MDIGEFKQRFLPLQRKMYLAAWRLLGNAQEAEDVVQEAYLKLWTRRGSLPKMESEKAYCITLVRNICLDRRRGQHPTVVSLDTARPAIYTLADINERIDHSLMAAKVKEAIKQLPEQQRLIITLKDIDDCDYGEISRSTGLSEVNIRVILSRARKAVRARFGR